MYCLANICYVCLENKSKPIRNINSSTVNEDIIHIIGYLPFNLGWLKTKQTILICEACCLHLRETYQFMKKCLKNSAVLQAYVDDLNASPISNIKKEAELLVKLNITHKSMDEVTREIQQEDEIIYTFQWKPNIEEIGDVFVDFEDSLAKEGIICKNHVGDKQEYPTDNNSTEITEETEDISVDFEDFLVSEGPVCKKEVDDMQDNNSTEIIEEAEDVFVNLDDYFVKEENTWKREEVDNVDEYPTDNNSTENVDNVPDSEIYVSDNAHLTNIDCASSRFTYTMRIHTGERTYECNRCKKRFTKRFNLVSHMRIHTGEKPYECNRCKKRFTKRCNLVCHMRIHTGEKPYSCSTCKKCFNVKANLMRHMRTHIGQKL